MNNSIFKNKKYIKWFIFVIWMIIWYLAAHLVGSELILPGPHAALKALVGLLGTGDFYLNVLWTVLRTVLGIVISFGLGVLFAVLANRSEPLREFLRLPVSFFKSIPVMAIIIYVILVVKSDWVAVVVCFLMCFPIAYTNMLNGLEALNQKYIELGRMLGLKGRQMVKYIIRPSLDTQIRTALSLITSMSWKVVVASEVLAIPKHSIGYQMLNSKYYLETADLFAYMIVLIVLSFGMEKLVDRISGMDPIRLSRAVTKDAARAGAALASAGTASVVFTDVTKTFANEDGSESKALADFTCSFENGVTAVLGPSGRGKTTMARLIAGLIVPDQGEVELSDAAKVGYLFQEDRLLPWLNVRANMLLGCLAGNASGMCSDASADAGSETVETCSAIGSGAVSESKRIGLETAVVEAAKKLEIEDALDMMPHELSGGMAHRAALGRTLLFGGDVLILDEPFRGLDEELRDRIIERISGELRPEGHDRTVILITHDEELAERLADRILKI